MHVLWRDSRFVLSTITTNNMTIIIIIVLVQSTIPLGISEQKNHNPLTGKE